jgi:hypothetical protein
METLDQQLEAALSFAQYQTTLNQQRRLLKEQFETDTVVAHNGGLFKVTQEWLGGFDTTSIWVLDMNGNPVVVADPENLYQLAAAAYKEALAKYGDAYQQLRRQRSVKTLTDL